MSGHCLLTVSALAAVMHQAPKEEHVDAFHDYMHKYDRRYQNGSDEYHQRLALFAQSRSVVAAQNARPGRRWTATLNALADRTEGELGQLRGWRGGVAAGGAGAPGGASGLMQRVGTFLSQRGRGRALPQEFMNWTKLRSARSSDQGECGSCWAVTSSEILRMHMEIYNPSSNRTFSAQELVSCVPNPHECGGSGGCQGATVELAFHWTQSQGLAQESETPYMASDVKCKKSGGLLQLSTGGSNEDVTAVGVHKAPADSPAAAFGMVGFERLAENGYEALLRGVVERGPVAISVAAKMWSFYSSGLFDSCGEDWEINHAVALVGYGKDETSGELFYLVQNSWGSDWGENGRIRILRRESDGEHCGMDTQPLLGTGCKGGPKQVRVCGPCGILYDNVVPHFKRLGQ